MKEIGRQIAELRRGKGFTQEKLAELLNISPQAISKWENGHTLPDTSLLPALSKIFDCTIDCILLPKNMSGSSSSDKDIELEQQAKHIAKYLINNMEEITMNKGTIGLEDSIIINALNKVYGNLGSCKIHRDKPIKTNRSINTSITITAPQKKYKLFEKVLFGNDAELHRYDLFNRMKLPVPRIYLNDLERKIILMDDLSDNYFQGFEYDEDTENGKIFRENYNTVLRTAANVCADFWDNYDVFGEVGLPWHLATNENFFVHMNGVEKDYKKYKKAYADKDSTKHFEYYEYALKYLREEYVKLFDSRFHAGKNITVILGDLHPGNVFMSRSEDRDIRFIDMEAVRMGVCTEDLAMLLALHIEPDKKLALPLLDYYYQCLCEKVNTYDYETFMNDYKISIMENLFFPLRLINRGILDFRMRDKSIKAFETFVLGVEG
ncbi:MAG: hypothetical protein K0S55_1476 [Clostridia bacterium]|nr:hypothetical protein [Clostridia bacterium]